MTRQSLRQHLIISTVIIVTVTSTLFAAGVLLIKQRLEESTFGSMVKEHMTVLLNNPQKASVLSNPLFDEWQFYYGDNVAQLPQYIREKKPGAYHSVPIGDHYYHLQVADSKLGRAYLLYDITGWEFQEHELLWSLAYGILIVLVVALVIASRAATRILAPVRKLTARLAVMHPGQRNVRIAEDFADPDIGQIAAAFDLYAARIDQFVERERSFTAAASHELRTPLSVMLGAVDVIEANNPSAASGRALERIRRACGEMQAFIEATLLLSREEERAVHQTSSTDVRDVLQHLLEDSRQMIASSSVTFETEFAEPLVLEVPESIVKITLGNLLRNAIEHTHSGVIRLELKAGRFTIRDTGEGISEQDLPHVFDRSYTTKPDGTGLGLNMVKRICDRFGWEVAVHSERGVGTKIEITFQS